MKCGFVFPGQGSQYVGMAGDLYDASTLVKDLFQRASDILGMDIAKLCKEGPDEELKQTENAQPAIVTASIGCYLLLKEEGIIPQVVAGHSLGEYTALIASGALSIEDGLRIVKKRGQLMQNSFPRGKAGMAAIIGLDRNQILSLCQQVSPFGVLEPANYNCPGQVVVSGDKEGIDKGESMAIDMGAKKYIHLNVSGPFHSSLMKGIASSFQQYLDGFDIKKPNMMFVSNTTGTAVSDSQTIRSYLIKQLYSPVLWEDSVNYIIKNGVTTCIEVGPGRVLSGLMRRIDSSLSTRSVSDTRTLKKTIAFFKEAD